MSQRTRLRSLPLWLLLLLVCPIRPAWAQAPYRLWTGQSGAQTQIDVNHTSSWHILVKSGSVAFAGGTFTMKKGPSATTTVTLKVYQGSSSGATLLASVTKDANAFTGQFTPIDLGFAGVQTLTAGRYYVTLTASAPDTQSQAFFIKGAADALISLDGVTPIDPAIAVVSSTPDTANLTLTKTAPASMAANGTMSYTLAVGNDGGSPSGTTATVRDVLPAGVVATAVAAGSGTSSVNCTNLNAAGATLTCTLAMASIPSAAPPTASFTITATAPNSGGSITNYASVDPTGGSSPSTPGASCSSTSCASASTTVTGGGAPSLTIAQTASPATFVRGDTGSFTLTVTNTGAAATDGSLVTVTDTLPTGFTPTLASGSGWTCGIAGQAVTCTRSDALAIGSSFPSIALSVTVAGNAAAALTNMPSVVGGGDSTPASTSLAVDVADPVTPSLTVTNTPNASTLTRGGSGTFTLEVSNSGTAATDGTGVTLTDVLPSGLTPATAAGSGWSCSITSQTVTCTRGDVLAASARYPAVSVDVLVDSSAPASLTSTASVSGGGDATAATGSSTVTAVSPTTIDLQITHTSGAVIVARGSSAAFTINVRNAGASPTDGSAVTVTDTAPVGLTPSVATGTGWTCGITGQTVTCGRSDVLPAGAQYEPIYVTAAIASDAPASMTPSAAVSGGGDSTVATASVTIGTGAPELAVSYTTSPTSPAPGGGVTLNVVVANSGPVATNGTTVTVSTTLPAGVTPVSASGQGWSCSVSGQTVTCVRGDVLNADAAYPPLAIGATLATSFDGSLTGSISVHGGGDSTAESTAIETTTGAPALALSLSAGAPSAARGGRVLLSLRVTNRGANATSGAPIVVSTTLAEALTASTASGSGWACRVNGPVVTCTRTDVLAPGAAAAVITITSEVAGDARGVLASTAVVSGGGSEPASASVSIPIVIDVPTEVSLAKVHQGDFVRGELEARFFLVVANTGHGTASGSTRIIDNVPAPLVPIRAGGDGWDCGIQAQTVTCSRNDDLPAGGSFPPASVSVFVPATAPDAIVNSATLNGSIVTNDIVAVSDRVTIIDPRPVELNVTKAVDRPQLRVGDEATFTVGATNASRFVLESVGLRDTLPAGFIYLPGTAALRVTGRSLEQLLTEGPSSDRSTAGARRLQSATTSDSGQAAVTIPIEGVVVNGEVVFAIGELVPGARAEITYRTVVAPSARAGRFDTRVVGTALSPLGEQVVTVPVDVEVRVVENPFSATQLLIGRVFEDSNRNGTLDAEEHGVPGVRVVTANGLSAITDPTGQFSLPSLAAGSTMVAVDPATIPAGLTLPAGDSRLGGGAKLLRTPLDGATLLRQNFALVPAATSAAARPTGPDATETVAVQSDPGAPLIVVPARSGLVAGGMDRQLVSIRVTDAALAAGQPIVRVRTSLGVLASPSGREAAVCDASARPEERPEPSQELNVKARNGVASVCLVSSAEPGDAVLEATVDPDGRRSARAAVRFDTSGRSPLLVAFGEAGVGLSGDPKPAADASARRADGDLNLFFQGASGGRDLLTVAVRSKESVNSATGATGLFERDPVTMPYPLMGDSSARIDLAQSSSRLYARYDYGHNFLLFGDLRADRATGGSGLLAFERNVTGLRGRVTDHRASRWLEVQASRPHTAYARETHDALGGSLVSLASDRIVAGSEVVILEVRDRRNPERTISRETLVRNVDFAIDPDLGLLQVHRRLPLFDQSLNLVQLVVSYEYETAGLESMAYRGIGSVGVDRIGLRVTGTGLVQSAREGHFDLGGFTLEQRLGGQGRLTIELPVSHGLLPQDVGVNALDQGERNGHALRMAVDRDFGPLLTVRARHERTDRGFTNPYGAVTVPGQTFTSAAADVRLTATTQASITGQLEENQNALVDNQRRTLGLRVRQRLGAHLAANAGIDGRRLEDALTDTHVSSQLASGGLQWKPIARLSTSVSREQNLGDPDPTYPDQTIAGAQFDAAPGARLFVTQRWSDAAIIPIGGNLVAGLSPSPLSTRETAVGVTSKVGRYTGVTTRYQMASTATGTDSFAVIGVTTRVPLRPSLSADFSIDNAMPLAGTPTGYFGGGVGLAYVRSEVLRMTGKYEVRERGSTEQIVTLGGVGQVTPSVSMLLNYRVAEVPTRVEGWQSETRGAVAIRPHQVDWAALLFSAERTSGGTFVVSAPTSTPNDRLSADGYLRLAPGLESYSRLSLFRTVTPGGESDFSRLVQTRLQRSLTRVFDVAIEGRRVEIAGAGSNVGAVELGGWVGTQLRIGLGYSSNGMTNSGSMLRSTAARGGPYLVFTSSLASMFDLMGGGR